MRYREIDDVHLWSLFLFYGLIMVTTCVERETIEYRLDKKKNQ